MNFLINCANLKKGGGVQVADSVCCQLGRFSRHQFVVVLSEFMDGTSSRIEEAQAAGGMRNVRVFRHTIRTNCRLLATRRDSMMDELVETCGIEAVLTIFGPSLWSPNRPHLCGFARAHLLLTDSPYFTRMGLKERLKNRLLNRVLRHYFDNGADALWTENPMISEKLGRLLPRKKVFTVSNYYNQVFDQSSNWVHKRLPEFDGATFLTVNAPYTHKNMAIVIDVARVLKRRYPDFRFRFAMTVNRGDVPSFDPELERNFLFLGKTDVASVPSLYRQAAVMFQPTLLECFSATYPEAMRMDVPIVTTDLDFAKGLCGEAAEYYSPLDPEEAAAKLYRVATDSDLRLKLIEAGRRQIKQFNTYEERADRLIALLEQLIIHN